MKLTISHAVPFFGLFFTCLIIYSMFKPSTFGNSDDVSPIPIIHPPDDIQIFAFMTVQNMWHEILSWSLYRWGSHLNVLGIGSECPVSCSITRLERMRDFLAAPENAYLENTLIVNMDGWDTGAQRHVKHIIDAYIKIEEKLGVHRPLIYAGEENCFPFDSTANGGWNMGWGHNITTSYGIVDGSEMCELMRNHDPGKFPYLNGGGYVGYPKEIIAWLDQVLEIKVTDLEITNKGDQAACQIALLRHPELKAFVDSNADIFLTFQCHNDSYFSRETCGEDYFENGDIPDFITGTKPVLTHYNGKGKGPWREVCAKSFRDYVDQYNLTEAFYVDIDNEKVVKRDFWDKSRLKYPNWEREVASKQILLPQYRSET